MECFKSIVEKYDENLNGNGQSWNMSAKSLKRLLFRDDGIFKATSKSKRGRKPKSYRLNKEFNMQVKFTTYIFSISCNILNQRMQNYHSSLSLDTIHPKFYLARMINMDGEHFIQW